MNFFFSDTRKNRMLTFMEIRDVGAELFHACRANVTVRSRNFPNAPKMIRQTNVACSERYSLQVSMLCWTKPVDVCCALLPLDVTSCLTITAIRADAVISAR